MSVAPESRPGPGGAVRERNRSVRGRQAPPPSAAWHHARAAHRAGFVNRSAAFPTHRTRGLPAGCVGPGAAPLGACPCRRTN